MNARLRVMHVVSADLWAGAEVFVSNLVKAQIADTAVHVVALNSGRLVDEVTGSGAKVTVIDESRLSGILVGVRLNAAIKDWRPDVIHTHRMKENVIGSIAGLINGVPSVQTVHGGAEFHNPWWRLKKSIPQALDFLCGRYIQSRVIAVSPELARVLARRFGESRITLIENGIDGRAVRMQAELASPLGAPTGRELRIGSIGRLVPVKRIDVLLQSVALLRRTGEKIEAYVIGDGPLSQELQDLATDLQIDQAVNFTGAVEFAAPYLKALDALLITSDHEGLPMVLLEAFALGVPVIAHAVGGMRSFSESQVPLTLVEQQDPSAYAREIRRLGRLPARARTIQKIRASVLPDSHDISACAKNYSRVYQSVISTRRKRSSRS